MKQITLKDCKGSPHARNQQGFLTQSSCSGIWFRVKAAATIFIVKSVTTPRPSKEAKAWPSSSLRRSPRIFNYSLPFYCQQQQQHKHMAEIITYLIHLTVTTELSSGVLTTGTAAEMMVAFLYVKLQRNKTVSLWISVNNSMLVQSCFPCLSRCSEGL